MQRSDLDCCPRGLQGKCSETAEARGVRFYGGG